MNFIDWLPGEIHVPIALYTAHWPCKWVNLCAEFCSTESRWQLQRYCWSYSLSAMFWMDLINMYVTSLIHNCTYRCDCTCMFSTLLTLSVRYFGHCTGLVWESSPLLAWAPVYTRSCSTSDLSLLLSHSLPSLVTQWTSQSLRTPQSEWVHDMHYAHLHVYIPTPLPPSLPPSLISIVCPEEEADYAITFWTVMSKVRLEAVMWVSTSWLLR